VIHAFERPFFEAFLFLSQYRRIGLSAGRVPLQEIVTYLNELGVVSQGLRLDYIKMISALDDEYLKIREKRNEAEQTKSQGK